GVLVRRRRRGSHRASRLLGRRGLTEQLEIRSIGRPAAAEPAGMLVLTHGRGADEHDLLPLADILDPGRRLIAVLPRGPLRPPPAGILALSGFVPTVPGFELGLEARAGLPVAIGHGTHDPVIGVEWGRRARALLEGAGADVRYRESPMAHSIDPAYLPELQG